MYEAKFNIFEPCLNFDDLYQNGDAAQRNHPRQDVKQKKILRACRSYYEKMINNQYNVKKLKRRINWNDQSELLFYTELYCEKIFGKDILKIMGVDHRSIANHLQAFLCSKKTLGDQLKNRRVQPPGNNSKTNKSKLKVPDID